MAHRPRLARHLAVVARLGDPPQTLEQRRKTSPGKREQPRQPQKDDGQKDGILELHSLIALHRTPVRTAYSQPLVQGAVRAIEQPVEPRDDRLIVARPS